MTYAGRTIWITGAASGIGAGLARAFHAAGGTIVASDRDEGGLVALSKVLGDRVTVLPFDVTDADGHGARVDRVLAQHGAVDVLVNNAGITQRSLVKDTSLAVYRTLMEVDYFAPVALTLAVLPHMLKRGQGRILVTTSVAGKFGTPLRSGYCAAKHACHGFFDSLRAEVAGDGVRVHTIVPGGVQTNVSVNALVGDGSRYGVMDAAMADGFTPDELAARVLAGIAAEEPEITIAQGVPAQLLDLLARDPRALFKAMQTVKTT